LPPSRRRPPEALCIAPTERRSIERVKILPIPRLLTLASASSLILATGCGESSPDEGNEISETSSAGSLDGGVTSQGSTDDGMADGSGTGTTADGSDTTGTDTTGTDTTGTDTTDSTGGTTGGDIDCSTISGTGTTVGSVMNNVTGTDWEGNPFNLHDYCNQTVLLDISGGFW
jgi:hypothetical protein